MKDVIVVGGGASGLLAAYAAASNGHRVRLLEKNEKAGKKIYITGKGRCNVTNDCLPDEFLQNVVRGAKFLTSAVYAFPPQKLMRLLEENGLPLKTERGNRVFPVSDHASDVTKALVSACTRAGVDIAYGTAVTGLLIEDGAVRGVRTAEGDLGASCVVLCTGGLSYPSTGSTGDGYRFAEAAGHTIVPCVPSLTGLNAAGDFSQLQGVSLRNVVLSCERQGKVLSSRLGELLFTHYGISGPLVLSLSAEICRTDVASLSLFLDLKPALSAPQLDARLVRDFTARKNEQMKNVMRGLLPAKLCPPVLYNAGIAEKKQANAVTREERARLVEALKRYPIRPVSLRGFSEAVVTSGGVSLKEVNPKTMESRLVRGLYLCGELLDADAYTGGFNLQLAFSTGYIAGNSI